MSSARPGSSSYYVTETLRFRACDDAPGPLTASITQTKKTGTFIVAHAVSLHRLSLKSAGCGSYKISWRLREVLRRRPLHNHTTCARSRSCVEQDGDAIHIHR